MIIGIDPGFTGGLAIVDDEQLLEVFEMPLHTGKRKRVCGTELSMMLADWRRLYECNHAVVEFVAARPNQGVTSVFNFGMSYGVILGVLDTLGFSVSYAAPQKWKKDLSLDSSKDSSRALACELWPDLSSLFSLKKDDGKAEAALMAYWKAVYGDENDSDEADGDAGSDS